MSKAQEKRNKEFRQLLTNRLTRLFKPFRNYNYQSYLNSKIKVHEDRLKSIWSSYSTPEEAFNDLNGKTFRELGIEPYVKAYTDNHRRRTKTEMMEARELALDSKITRPSQLRGKIKEVQESREIMDLLEINRLTWLEEVRDSFDVRFNKMIESMCNKIEPKKNGFNIVVEEVSNSWEEFEVLIHVENTTFHARAIWVNCVDKISHYRFITTTRKNG